MKPWHIQRVEQWRRRLNTAFDSAELPADRRQIMVTSMAVQSAWFYCLRYAGGAYFPEEETEEPVGKFPE